MRRAPEFSAQAPADRPSKSELKRQMHDLQALGQDLIDMPPSRCDAIDLPENLRDALAEYRRTRSFEGKRRQLQYIGKLMRQIDPAPVRDAVAAWKLGSATDALTLHEAERWREQLLAGDDAVTRWVAQYPDTDAQQLRNLVRSARKDIAAQASAPPGSGPRHGRSYRDLFQQIRQQLKALPQGNPAAEDVVDD